MPLFQAFYFMKLFLFFLFIFFIDCWGYCWAWAQFCYKMGRTTWCETSILRNL